MREELLSILVEPRTHSPLELTEARRQGGEIVEGVLKSAAGGRYPIVGGIPRFVGDGNYAGSFGLQWNRFSGTQLDSVNGQSFSRKRFEDEVRWTRQWCKDKLILDAGCGAGRFSEIAAGTGCRLVSVDMSSAIDAAAKSLYGHENISFVQADICNLPFRPSTFDGMYCIGVLQHTENPAASLRNLIEAVIGGGRFAVTIYARRPWTMLYSKYLARKFTRGMSDEKLLRLIESIMPAAFPLTEVLFRAPVVGKLFEFLIPVANYVHKSGLSRRQRYEEAVLDTFDMLSPKYDNPVTAGEVLAVLKEVGVASCEVLSGRPVNIIGVR
jgi:2-polyprenyl-3-methyl-5-hydroxy-6-metoxy-1,4-benzoquinol methylase/uncharacterized protein YbaR (Trm112 family)